MTDGTRTRLSAVERRNQLVQVGRAVFAEKGYEGASVEEIAERVALRGWASVVFVENAYLRTGHPEPWAEHQAEIAPVNRARR